MPDLGNLLNDPEIVQAFSVSNPLFSFVLMVQNML